MTIDIWVGPISALAGTGLGAWLTHTLSAGRWLKQQQWAIREKRYMDLIEQLTKAEIALQGQSQYYAETGSEHHNYDHNAHFVELGDAAGAALRAVEQLAGPAQVFLSQRTVASVNELIKGDWSAAYGASFPGEYIEVVLPLVRKAHETLVTEARAALTASEG